MAYCGGPREWDTTKTNPETEPRIASAEGAKQTLDGGRTDLEIARQSATKPLIEPSGDVF